MSFLETVRKINSSLSFAVKWVYLPSSYRYLNEQERSRYKNRRKVINVIAYTALVFITFISVWIAIRGTDAERPLSDDVTLIIALNFLIVPLIIITLVVGRNLVKLYLDRRTARVGGNLQVKLVISFLAMTVIPTIIIFIVASGLLSQAVDRWINSRIENTISLSIQVSSRLNTILKDLAKPPTFFLAKSIDKKLKSLDSYDQRLDNFLRRKISEYGFDSIRIYNSSFRLISSISTGYIPAYKPDTKSIKERLLKEDISLEILKDEQKPIAVFFAKVGKDKENPKGYIAVFELFSQETFENMKKISEGYTSYNKLLGHKDLIKTTYQLTLALICLVIVFSAIWIGFKIAQGIAIPINKLSEGVNLVSKGQLNVRIDMGKADDEINRLVDAFNKMTSDLEKSEISIKRANEKLISSNLELKNSKRYIETILENIGTGVISVNKSGIITTVNRFAQTLLNIQDKEIKGRKYTKVLNKKLINTLVDILRSPSSKGKDRIEKTLKMLLCENIKNIKVVVSFLKDEQGEYAGTVLVMDDLTQLISVRRAEIIKDMTSLLAHEIKNPLTPIQLNAQRMLKKFHENSKDFKDVFENATKTIIQEVEALKLLVMKFSSFSKQTIDSDDYDQEDSIKSKISPSSEYFFKPEILSFNINEAISDLVNLYKGIYQGIEIKVSLDPALGSVKLDIEQFKRAIINLIENGLDAMKKGKGTLSITTRHLPSDMVLIEIKDTGEGIRSDNKEKIFNRHFSTKKDGVGLGLTIVKKIVENHAGYIKVSDNKPKGTRFNIILPIR